VENFIAIMTHVSPIYLWNQGSVVQLVVNTNASLKIY